MLHRAIIIVLLAAAGAVRASGAGEEVPLKPLTDSEWRRYLSIPPYAQPTWTRQDLTTSSNAHLLLQRASQMHQQGDLEKAVTLLKSVLQKTGQEYHGEAYALLSKVCAQAPKNTKSLRPNVTACVDGVRWCAGAKRSGQVRSRR